MQNVSKLLGGHFSKKTNVHNLSFVYSGLSLANICTVNTGKGNRIPKMSISGGISVIHVHLDDCCSYRS